MLTYGKNRKIYAKEKPMEISKDNRLINEFVGKNARMRIYGFLPTIIKRADSLPAYTGKECVIGFSSSELSFFVYPKEENMAKIITIPRKEIRQITFTNMLFFYYLRIITDSSKFCLRIPRRIDGFPNLSASIHSFKDMYVVTLFK